jgi:integrase
MTAVVNHQPAEHPGSPDRWAEVRQDAPVLAATAERYLAQIAVSLRPASVVSASIVLRLFCEHLVYEHPDVAGFAQVGRVHVESYKLALAAHRTAKGTPLAVNTMRMRLGMLMSYFDRIIEWGYDDAPARNPMFIADVPRPEDSLPKALDDAAAARFLREAAAEPDPLRRLVVELLARTGIRVGELCALQAGAVSQRGGGWWLHVPVGKLRNDRVVPLFPPLVELLTDWQAGHPNTGTGLLLTNRGRPLNRHAVTRMVNRVARRAGIGHVHPHQLRHTLATQAVNRGMRLESIAELLGHRTLRMTIRYARIANTTVADEYRAATGKVEALYDEPPPLPETPAMRRLRLEHARMLGNGWCTRPAHMDCSFEALCEGCGFFATTVEFKPTLTRQRDHAASRGQADRTALFDKLLDGLDTRSGGAPRH